MKRQTKEDGYKLGAGEGIRQIRWVTCSATSLTNFISLWEYKYSENGNKKIPFAIHLESSNSNNCIALEALTDFKAACSFHNDFLNIKILLVACGFNFL